MSTVLVSAVLWHDKHFGTDLQITVTGATSADAGLAFAESKLRTSEYFEGDAEIVPEFPSDGLAREYTWTMEVAR